MLDIYSKKLLGIITDAQIIEASREVFCSVFDVDPFHDHKAESFDKYENIKFDLINPDDRIVDKFLYRKDRHILCLIVLPPGSIEYFPITKFYLNLYEVENEERVIKCMQVLICSGVDACIVGQGDPEEIANLERALHQETSGEIAVARKWFGMDKKILNLLNGSALALAAAWIIFKVRNWF